MEGAGGGRKAEAVPFCEEMRIAAWATHSSAPNTELYLIMLGANCHSLLYEKSSVAWFEWVIGAIERIQFQTAARVITSIRFGHIKYHFTWLMQLWKLNVIFLFIFFFFYWLKHIRILARFSDDFLNRLSFFRDYFTATAAIESRLYVAITFYQYPRHFQKNETKK